MFLSKCLVSKKGPLGAIWVAAYFFKKLKKAQIFDTNISSSVDNILQEQLEILAYRVLAYLLLGVVRIYSKKVEYLFDDCQEVLIKINEFVVREKNRAKKEALRAACFSITRPVSFDLDSFDLEILEDNSGDNEVPSEMITLKDLSWKNAGTWDPSQDRFAALDDNFLLDYTPTEDLSCHLIDFEAEAKTSNGASMEKLRYGKPLHEEISHVKTVSSVEEEPSNLVKVLYKNDKEHVEVIDVAGLENHGDQEANTAKYNDPLSSEECVNLRSETEENPLFSLKLLAKDQSNRKGLDLSESDNEANQDMEEDHESILEASARIPDIAGSKNHMGREASRDKCNDRSSTEGVNLHSEAEEEPLSSIKSLGEDQANGEHMKGLGLPQSDNKGHQVMKEDHASILETSVEVPEIERSENHIGAEASKENCYNDKFSRRKHLNLIAEIEERSSGLIKSFGEEQTNIQLMNSLHKVQLENEVHHPIEEDCHLGASMEKFQGEGFSSMDIEEPSPSVKPLGEEIQTGAEQVKFPATTTANKRKRQVAAKDHKLSVTLDSNPWSKFQDASGTTTPHFMLIPTPAAKERARFSRKRKCLYDDMIVFPNDMMRQWIKDASDLVSKRGKGSHTALAARKPCWISKLSQSFAEPSVPCTSELKYLYCAKRLRLQESIMKPPVEMDASEPLIVARPLEQAEIAPQIVEIRDPPDKLNLSESPLLDGSSEHAGIAPQTPALQSPSRVVGEQAEIAPRTPVLHSKSLRTFESYLKCDNLDEAGQADVGTSEGIEKEPPVKAIAKKVPPVKAIAEMEPSVEAIVEKEPSLNKIVETEPSLSDDEDLDLNLLSEEVNSNEDDNQGKDGWSTRTRMVAKQLQKCFSHKRKRGKKEKVKLSQLLEGRTKKESARFFYEILVLKTKGLVDVKQDTAFGNILVLKAHHLHN